METEGLTVEDADQGRARGVQCVIVKLILSKEKTRKRLVRLSRNTKGLGEGELENTHISGSWRTTASFHLCYVSSDLEKGSKPWVGGWGQRDSWVNWRNARSCLLSVPETKLSLPSFPCGL